ncbi:hypothetical protein bcgnr5390_13150 [Bacillus luti]|nr:hypothetical protein BC2903_51820 [Bacillus cereus]
MDKEMAKAMAMDPPYYDGRYETGTPKAIAEKVVVDLPLEVRNTMGGNPFVLPEIVIPKKEA